MPVRAAWPLPRRAGRLVECEEVGFVLNDGKSPDRPYLDLPDFSHDNRVARVPSRHAGSDGSSFSRRTATRLAIGTRLCSIESRSRIVTASSSSVSKSMVTAYGV